MPGSSCLSVSSSCWIRALLLCCGLDSRCNWAWTVAGTHAFIPLRTQCQPALLNHGLFSQKLAFLLRTFAVFSL